MDQTKPNNMMPAPENKSSIGGVIGTIIIIAVIILGALYFWGKRIEENRAVKVMTSENQTATSSNEASAIRSMGSSDDTTSIETDLKATNTTNLDKEVQ